MADDMKYWADGSPVVNIVDDNAESGTMKDWLDGSPYGLITQTGSDTTPPTIVFGLGGN